MKLKQNSVVAFISATFYQIVLFTTTFFMAYHHHLNLVDYVIMPGVLFFALKSFIRRGFRYYQTARHRTTAKTAHTITRNLSIVVPVALAVYFITELCLLCYAFGLDDFYRDANTYLSFGIIEIGFGVLFEWFGNELFGEVA